MDVLKLTVTFEVETQPVDSDWIQARLKEQGQTYQSWTEELESKLYNLISSAGIQVEVQATGLQAEKVREYESEEDEESKTCQLCGKTLWYARTAAGWLAYCSRCGVVD